MTRPYSDAETGPLGPRGPLQPFIPEPLDVSRIVYRRIVGWTDNAGAGGVSGDGFLGFDLDGDWLIVAVFQANGFTSIDGEVLRDLLYELKDSRIQRRMSRDAADALFVGDMFTSISVERHRLEARLATGRTIVIGNDGAGTTYQGEKLSLDDDDDLRHAIFLSPSPDLWSA